MADVWACASNLSKNFVYDDRSGDPFWCTSSIALSHEHVSVKSAFEWDPLLFVFPKFDLCDQSSSAVWHHMGIRLHQDQDPPLVLRCTSKLFPTKFGDQFESLWYNLKISFHNPEMESFALLEKLHPALLSESDFRVLRQKSIGKAGNILIEQEIPSLEVYQYPRPRTHKHEANLKYWTFSHLHQHPHKFHHNDKRPSISRSEKIWCNETLNGNMQKIINA